MTTKSEKSCKAKSASGNGESGAATTPSDDDDDERLNLSASLRDANPRPLIQLANLAPQLRKPNTTLVKTSKPRLSTDLAGG